MQRCHIILGRNVQSEGIAMSSIICKISAIMKGITPRYILPILVSVVPAKAKRLIPNGGVIMPTSIILTFMTHHHIGSKPMLTMMGKITGIVKTITAYMSKNMPQMIYMSKIMVITTYGDAPSPTTKSLALKGI